MAVLALITKKEDVAHLVSWSCEFSRAHRKPLKVLCWAYSPEVVYPLFAQKQIDEATEELVVEVRRVLGEYVAQRPHVEALLGPDKVTIRRILHPDSTAATLEFMQGEDISLLVAAAEDPTAETGATFDTNPLLRQAPCQTLIFFGGARREVHLDSVFVATAAGPHARAVVECAGELARVCDTQVSIAQIEDDAGADAREVGRRELQHLVRAAGLKKHKKLRAYVFLNDEADKIISTANEHDLVLLGANHPTSARTALETTQRPQVAIVKRRPPLKLWRRGPEGFRWLPRLNAADYADLVQGLRQGSKLTPDFLIMLSLAAAIATLGLLQDSPAVVIGSMLLAPLMTPMITTGLGLAQANPKLVQSSLKTVFFGFLATLAISYLIGFFAPGEEMTPQVLARGNPNLLDLMIALFSAAAAAYALARPSIAGAVAGVAIATALVPPLCSVGISIAYSEFGNAYGATLLFVTNLVAIVLGAAVMFRLMGVMAARADAEQRRWIYRSVGVFCLIILVLYFPLLRALERNIERGMPQPRTYPLTKAVEDAINEHIESIADVKLIASGRPSSLHAQADVVLVLMTPSTIEQMLIDDLVKIVRAKMDDPELVVEVYCVRQAEVRPATST